MLIFTLVVCTMAVFWQYDKNRKPVFGKLIVMTVFVLQYFMRLLHKMKFINF